MSSSTSENRRLKVFLCHASGDKIAVQALYERLSRDKVEPWLDKEDLIAGQDWETEIRKAVRESDAVLVCLSSGFNQAGFRQKEVRFALDVADEQLEGTIFVIPVKLEECEVPERLSRWHWVDLFEERGYGRLLQVLVARAQYLGIAVPGEAEEEVTFPSDTPDIDAPAVVEAQTVVIHGVELEMIRIPAGPFLMGSDEGSDNEKPQREVYLDAYEIAKHPLTNAQYKAFLDANLDHPESRDRQDRTFPEGKANHPVVYISWNDAVACAKWYGLHLLTEAQWEKAARGTDGRKYPWGNEFDKDKCNSWEGGRGDTTPVSTYPGGASPYGVMDMAGNVWEWCADWYGEDYDQRDENRNPTGPEDGQSRVVRSGSWLNDPFSLRCSLRFWLEPHYQVVNLGVRFSRTD